ncbi:MAG: LysR family transcriptional regulator [Planctomycetota bacterium]
MSSPTHALQLFLDVARLRSFSRAAEVHGVTQSAASQCVGQIERRLGVQLVDRSTRPLALTPAGERYSAGLDDLLPAIDRLEDQVRKHADAGRVVRVAAIYSCGIQWLSRCCSAFEAEHGVEVETRFEQHDEVRRLVLEGEADLGLVSFPKRWAGLTAEALRTETIAVVCAPGHRLTREVSVHARHLTGLEMLGFDPGLPIAEHAGAYLRRHGAEPRVVHRFDNLDTLKNALPVAGGFALLPLRTVRRELDSGELAAVRLTPALERPIATIRARGAEPSADDAVAELRARLALPEPEPELDAPTPAGHIDGPVWKQA